MSKVKTTLSGDKIFKCPGCHLLHSLRVTGTEHPVWNYNGKDDSPTFSPSILATDFSYEDGGKIVCHSFVKDGYIHFLSDCTHDLKDKTVEMLEWPYKPSQFGGLIKE